MDSFVDTLNERIARIEGGELDGDTVIGVYDQALSHVQNARELFARCEAAVLQWIELRGDLNYTREDGSTVRYYGGVAKVTKCVDKPGTLTALLDAAGGDYSAIAEYLASEPFKHGAVSKFIAPDVYAKCFATEEKIELREGKPARKLMKVDSRFVK